MDNYIKIKNFVIDDGRVVIEFEISDNLKVYFKQTTFWYEMVGIEKVPKSIAVIPFICNVLPIVWLTDSTILLDTLDIDFYKCIDEIKEGYANMYPMLSFKGHILPTVLEENKLPNSGSVVMFSGGVDAICTTIRHISEHPLLLTVWGSADYPVSDEVGWKKQWDNLCYNSKMMGLDCHFIKSNFCELFNLWSPGCQDLLSESGETWWHGIQHGIGILGHSAPFAYIHKCRIAYMASSYHESQRPFTCASDPTIDSKVRYGSTECFHDAFELTRQDKVAELVRYVEKTGVKFNIHVCLRQFQSTNNCCKCEKCYRTILELMVEGADPKDFGFDNFDVKNIIDDINNKIVIPFTALPFYKDMQKKVNGGGKSVNAILANWLNTVDFNEINNGIYKKIYVIKCKLHSKLCRILNIILKSK